MYTNEMSDLALGDAYDDSGIWFLTTWVEIKLA